MTYPVAADPSKVGSYDAKAFAGGGYVWDEVLEYRVWCNPGLGESDLAGGDDYFYAFVTFAEAQAAARQRPGAEDPIALVLQREYIDEPSPGVYQHVKHEPTERVRVRALAQGPRLIPLG